METSILTGDRGGGHDRSEQDIWSRPACGHVLSSTGAVVPYTITKDVQYLSM